MNIDNAIRVKALLSNNFFSMWLNFLKPFHNLSKREIEIASFYLKKRYELSLKINDIELVDQIVFSKDTKREIKVSNNLSNTNFQIIMNNLRKKGFIVDQKINPKFIPRIKEDSKSFSFLLLFEVSE